MIPLVDLIQHVLVIHFHISHKQHYGRSHIKVTFSLWYIVYLLGISSFATLIYFLKEWNCARHIWLMVVVDSKLCYYFNSKFQIWN
jgi:hypothetical protein